MTDDWSEPTEVPIQAIRKEPRFQVRAALDEPTLIRYTMLHRNNESKFPPISLARLKGSGVLYVVDGWHRLEAAVRAGKRTILACAAPMSEREALSAAVRANTKHGLPLKREDLRRLFDTYLAAGEHLDGNRRKSLRRMASELGGLINYNTIRNWLREADIPEPEFELDPETADRVQQGYYSRIRVIQSELQSLYGELNDPFLRAEVIVRMREILTVFEAADDPPPIFGPAI